MNHIERISNNRFYDSNERDKEVHNVLDSILAADKIIHFMDMKVHPYGYAVPFREIFNNCKDLRRCTSSSQSILIDEMNGCIDIINHKIDLYNEPQVTIKIIEGKHEGEVVTYPQSIARDFTELGWAILL